MRKTMLVPFFLVIFTVSVQSQPAAQGAASIADLISQAEGGKSDSFSGNINDTIADIFGRPASTTAPTISGNSGGSTEGGIPGIGSCTCVPYYLCNNGSVNNNGEGIIDIRINDGPCNSYIEVCCEKDQQEEKPITPAPSPLKQTGCGYRNPEGIGFRITGDKENESQFGEFPWMVAVLREETIEGFNSVEKSCNSPVLTNNAQVVTSGITDSFNGEQYARPVYRKSMLGVTLCTTWTNWVNGKIVSPCSTVGQLITKSKRSGNSENNLKFQEKMEYFSKHLNDSLTQKFGNQQPTKPRAIRGGNLNPNHLDKIDNSSPAELQTFENGFLIKYQPRTQLSKSTNHNKQSPPRDLTCPPKCCKFCYNNGEPQVIYGSHMAKFVDGTVSCPILRRYVCELCGATGSYSHTRKYCPLYGNIVQRSQKLQKLI